MLVGFPALSQQVLPLYSDEIPHCIKQPNKEEAPTIQVFRAVQEKSTRSAVIIFPGGAYSFLAYTEEGILIAKAFATRGITAFVVKYRMPNSENMEDKSLGPLMDAQQALKKIRSSSDEWGIDSNKIGVVGYSAGGHLASTLGTHYVKSYITNKEKINLRPDFMILVYPVISMNDSITHLGSRNSLLGMAPSKEKVTFFSSELQVTKETPPTYLTHTGDDSLVDVKNSIIFYMALQKNNVDAELHLFPKGNHGFTQRLPVNEWLDPTLLWLSKEGFYHRPE